MRHLLAITGMLIFGSAVSAADPATPVFTQKPSTTRVGEGVKITFAVSAPTDVEVAILGGDGKIVRHLVAGALGKNPPEPLKPDSLAQEVVWDQKDDDGKPVAGGGCKARVRLGMKPEPDGFLLDNPDHLGPVRAMATDGKGRLVVLQSNPLNLVWWHGIGIKVFNHAGHYEKTLMPFPASLPNERLGDCKPMRTETGELVPRIFNAFLRCFYPDPSPTYAGGYYLYHSIAVDAKGRVFFPVFGPRLASVDADGGLPYPEFLGPTLLPEVKGLNSANRWGFGKDNIRLTVSSDNKWIYMGGLTTDPKTPKAIPCVYRLDIEKRGSAEKFVGDPDKPGTEKELLSSPCGMAVAKGILYIADKAAGRVAAFKEDTRAFVGEIRVADPDQVAVDPATGAIYVLSCSQEYAVIKFAGLGDGKEVCRHPFAPVSKKSPPICQMALDASEKPPVLWLTQNNLASNNSIVQQFLRMTDNGASFSKPEDPRSTEISAQHAHDLTVDRRRNELYIRTLGPVWARLEEKTGKITSPEFKLPGLNRPDLGTPVVVGEDGNIYAWSWLQTFSRFDHEGKPLNFPGSGKHQFELPVPMSFMVRGLYVKSADEMYGVVRNLRLDPGSTTGAGGWWTCLNVIGSDGKSKRTIIWECSQGAIVKLDRKGNIYLADMVKPAGRSYPEFFDGKLPLPPAQAVNPDGTGAQANSWLYGSIMKFPPSGGAIWYGPELKDKEGAPNFVRVGEPPAELLAKPKQKMMAHVGYLTRGTAEVQGALWIHFGYSPLTITSRTGNDTCMCEGSKFEVDDYGRVFFPNLNQFRIEVLDTNGNPITRFGSYGNLDSGGKAGKIVKPEIPLAWPVAVATSETHAYIGDSLNRRVVKVRLACAAEATADIR